MGHPYLPQRAMSGQDDGMARVGNLRSRWPRWIRIVSLAAVVFAIVAASGCSVQSSTGAVSGGIRLEGGAGQSPSYLEEHQAGTVIVQQKSKTVSSVREDLGHGFTVSLPAGKYHVSADVPGNTCQPLPVEVEASRSVNIEVTCLINASIG
jgi:hypothetical protein